MESLVAIEAREGYLRAHLWFGAKKKIRQLSGTHISETTGAISFKFGKRGCVHGQTKIYKVYRN